MMRVLKHMQAELMRHCAILSLSHVLSFLVFVLTSIMFRGIVPRDAKDKAVSIETDSFLLLG